jgi:hypothetical protein
LPPHHATMLAARRVNRKDSPSIIGNIGQAQPRR